MKKYLIKGMAMLSLGLVVAGCHDDTTMTNSDMVKHAENVLGLKIASDQDWKMSATAMANVSVNLNYGETYTVKVYSNNPLVDDVAYVLAKGKVQSGQTFAKSFDYPMASKSLYVGVTDSKGFTTYKLVAIEDDVLSATFGESAAGARSFNFTRSQSAPACSDITKPYDDAWVATYNETAKEPTDANVADNYDNSYYQGGSISVTTSPVLPGFNWGTKPNNAQYNGGNACTEAELAFFNDYWTPLLAAYNGVNLSYYPDDKKIDTHNEKIDKFYDLYNAIVNAGFEVSDWLNIYTMPVRGAYTVVGGTWVADENYVTNFKITGTWNGEISVAGSEGSSSPGAERTIVVTGTWNITADQRIGSLGKIIIARGGTVNVASGKTLSMVNEARLVVLPGGKLTGEGKVEVNNGNAEGLENYNGGTIDVAVFNNNFGKFYNYGKFLVTEYQGGAKESNFYNHSLVSIKHTGLNSQTPNARIFNACQWYCEGDMRCRNYEGVMGSAFIVGGQLMFSSSEDGTSTPSYVGLAAGALVKCGSLYNNGTSWTGPTSGYAALEIVNQIDFLNWEQDAPATGGYFENNIYVSAGTWDNVPDGNGMSQKTDNGTEDYTMSQAKYKFFSVVANCRGNGGVTKVVSAPRNQGGQILIPADVNFVLGDLGCTPGFTGKPDNPVEENLIWSYAFEDSYRADYDLNDCVVKVQEDPDDDSKLILTLCCTGASYNLYLYLRTPDGIDKPLFNGLEVHAAMGGTAGMFINTGNQQLISDNPSLFQNITTLATYKIDKPTGSTLGNLDIWLQSPEGEIHIATEGSDPHGVVIPLDWQWPKEFTNVKLAYVDDYDGFAQFAEGSTYGTSTWYTHPVSGNVITAADMAIYTGN